MNLYGGFERKHDTLDSVASLYEVTHMTAILSPLYKEVQVFSGVLEIFCGFENCHVKTT